MFNSASTIGAFRGPWGIRIEIDQSLLLLVGLLVYFSLDDITHGLIFGSMLVGSILLHELGHAWGCLVQGVPVRRVVLHGFGGFCEHARADVRRSELITLMGPLVNLALWAISGIAAWGLWRWAEADPILLTTDWFYDLFFYIRLLGTLNLALFVFNMLPVQPLDGGKLFHHLMLRLMGPQSAQKVTGAVGLLIAIAWIPAAIWGFVTFGFILFFFPSIKAHWRMMRGNLVF